MAQRRNRAVLAVLFGLAGGFAGISPGMAQEDREDKVQATRMSVEMLLPQVSKPESSEAILALMGASPVLSAANLLTGGVLLPLPLGGN